MAQLLSTPYAPSPSCLDLSLNPDNRFMRLLPRPWHEHLSWPLCHVFVHCIFLVQQRAIVVPYIFYVSQQTDHLATNILVSTWKYLFRNLYNLTSGASRATASCFSMSRSPGHTTTLPVLRTLPQRPKSRSFPSQPDSSFWNGCTRTLQHVPETTDSQAVRQLHPTPPSFSSPEFCPSHIYTSTLLPPPLPYPCFPSLCWTPAAQTFPRQTTETHWSA